jgi:hypothetical protein
MSHATPIVFVVDDDVSVRESPCSERIDFVRIGLSMWTMVSIEGYSLLRWLYGAYACHSWTRTSSLFLDCR